jgi:N-acetyl-alpha-D-muramate 1-phosphate uridylyltransferase
MDAMILAAGLGTRLGDVTRDLPKALVDVAGTPILEHVARRLIGAGADRLIINVHHHADRIVDFVESRDGFGVEVRFSRETGEPFETGGGLLHAAAHFRRDAPFLLHNVDVLCDTDLAAMVAAHEASGALATLAVSGRETTRHLLFDRVGLCGRADGRSGERTLFRAPIGEAYARAFAGIHVLSPALLERITERGAFSIMTAYARLSAEGEHIAAHDVSRATWHEIGNPRRLEAARRWVAEQAAG